ncbi:MAG TPA: vanadium-dependent haloperoxidase, partial [Steroidobacteraceae bacterium]|nr:vanadium-dependent haloperoxidase [Steroidobacteraceae bacterium]
MLHRASSHLRHCVRLGLLVALAVTSAEIKADVVADWDRVASDVLVANPAAHSFVHLAIAHVAIYDAVNAIDGRYSVYAIRPQADTQGASREAAAAAAGYFLLSTLFPNQQGMLDSAYSASLAAIPDGAAETKGIAVGKEVAEKVIALRANDGRNAVVPYVFGSGPGVYQATPPAFGQPITPYLRFVTPFALQRPDQFRAYGPPDVTSARYAADLSTVHELGSATSTKRSAAQTEIGRFHTEPPFVFWSRNLRNVALERNLDTAQSARLFAMLHVALADSLIGCWDSKYYYNSWRPITAIAAADTDGNPATSADAAWTPLATTPPHPEYPAAHGCSAGAVVEALNGFFGTNKVKMTFTSTVPGSVPHVFKRTEEISDEIAAARVYGGMHFPTSARHGVELGRKVGK